MLSYSHKFKEAHEPNLLPRVTLFFTDDPTYVIRPSIYMAIGHHLLRVDVLCNQAYEYIYIW